MAAHSNTEDVQRKPKVKDHSAKRHIVAFCLSILLTALAFVAVGFEIVPRSFTVPFIVVLAVIQALAQLFVWMHLDQKGHEFARLGIFTGSGVVLTAVIAFVYWVW